MFKSMADFLIDSPKFRHCKAIKIETINTISGSFDSWVNKVTQQELDEEAIKERYSFFHHYLNEITTSLQDAIEPYNETVIQTLLANLTMVANYYNHQEILKILKPVRIDGAHAFQKLSRQLKAQVNLN
jgi:hypothetical protein